MVDMLLFSYGLKKCLRWQLIVDSDLKVMLIQSFAKQLLEILRISWFLSEQCVSSCFIWMYLSVFQELEQTIQLKDIAAKVSFYRLIVSRHVTQTFLQLRFSVCSIYIHKIGGIKYMACIWIYSNIKIY